MAKWSEKVRSGLFEPDVILHGQVPARGQRAQGERMLMLAVLEDAINCFQSNLFATHPKERQLFHEADEWLMADRPDSPLPFRNVCSVIGLDPGYVRRGLQRWREREQAARAHQAGRSEGAARSRT